jgi:S-disulfanyl-L-cysteine oxidoreductase SoxD
MAARKLLWLGALAVLLCAAAAIALWSRNTAQGEPWRLRPDDAKLLAMGRQVYEARCASCHGARLEGQPNWRQPGTDGLLPAPPHDVSGHTWHHPDEMLFRITKYGVARAASLANHASAMPAFEGVLSDTEIVAALSWIKSQWPPSVQTRHDALNRHDAAAR